MLTNLLGIRLMMLLGPSVPLPAPYAIAAAFSRLEVTNDSGETGDGFQLTLLAGRDSLMDYGLVKHPLLQPMTRVILAAVFGVVPEVLVDGVITHAQFNPGNGPGQGTVTVTGRDLTALMDLEEKNDTHPNQADFLIVSKIIGQYARYGIVPMPQPTFDFPIMLERTPSQEDTDLAYLRALARQNGFVFYLEPITIGATRAYFGPPPRLGVPQSVLSVNLGASTNVRSIHFGADALAAVSASGELLEPRTGMTIPIPALPSLKVPPLAAAPSTPQRRRLQRDAAQHSPGKAATSLVAAGMNAPDSDSAQGELDSARYGHVLRARQLVGLRGAGWTHDGLWSVRRVTHALSRQGYSQQFELRREGKGSLLPALPT